ncbi:methyl-accepting chemotaxis protein [Cohnella pontilimi]|uniref:Methyl-accepting chemotaxis protein n=1 Tax=Cohnella pontilimi TaxID=2564100 RepID=A0A4U0FB46_9BACL|nr:methyl-accepting chemotaxis protein [Cohnella pontilimi]TJY41798.1 methyl-accepting chemotaxis protein [Cohnella pontilimi]
MSTANEAKAVSLPRYLSRTVIPAVIGAGVLAAGLLYANGIKPENSGFWPGVGTMAVAGALLGVLIGYLNYRRFVSPMNSIIQHIRRMADGDLSHQLDISRIGMLGPIGESVNRLTDNLGNVMAEANRTSEQVSTLSESLKVTTRENTAALQQVAASIQQTAGENHTQAQDMDSVQESVSGIHHLVTDIADKTGAVSDTAAQMTAEAEAGRKALQEVVAQMNQIQKSVSASQSTVHVLNERMQAIGEIMGVITLIASQTNLLALNAAIEATRAGENGRGFVVVSTEIRKLADQSHGAIAKISDILEAIEQDSSKSTRLLDQESEEVAVGIQLIGQTSRMLDNIHRLTGQVAESVQSVSQEIGTIASRSLDSREHMERMTGRIRFSFAETDNAAAVIEELLASTENIQSVMEQLHETAVALEQHIREFQS